MVSARACRSLLYCEYRVEVLKTLYFVHVITYDSYGRSLRRHACRLDDSCPARVVLLEEARHSAGVSPMVIAPSAFRRVRVLGFAKELRISGASIPTHGAISSNPGKPASPMVGTLSHSIRSQIPPSSRRVQRLAAGSGGKSAKYSGFDFCTSAMNEAANWSGMLRRAAPFSVFLSTSSSAVSNAWMTGPDTRGS